jgi:tRNA(Ile)-lysidine synthase
MNMLYERTKKYISDNGLVRKDQKIGIAVSGGVDSMCLLEVFISLKNELNLSIFALHFEHGIRPAESVADKKFVAAFCEDKAITFVSKSRDVPLYASQNKQSIETAARNLRYRFFEDCSSKFGLDSVALAHHIDDQAETVLFNLVRGSGTKGLCGMQPFRRPNYIRPFLDVSKADIEGYAVDNKISFSQDQSNFDVAYTRNKIRHEVFSKLNEINSNAASNIGKSSKILSDEYDYIDAQVEKIYGELVKYCDGEAVLSLEKWDEHHIAVKRRLLRKTIEKAFDICDMGFTHIESVIDNIDGKSGKNVDIANGISVAISYGDLYIFKVKNRDDRVLNLDDSSDDFSFGGYRFKKSITHNIAFSETSEVFNKKSIAGCVFRYSMPDDYICPLGMKGKKKLSDYMCDIKIPKHKRAHVLLLCKKSEVVWVVGYGISENYKVSATDRKVLQIEYSDNA